MIGCQTSFRNEKDYSCCDILPPQTIPELPNAIDQNYDTLIYVRSTEICLLKIYPATTHPKMYYTHREYSQ